MDVCEWGFREGASTEFSVFRDWDDLCSVRKSLFCIENENVQEWTLFWTYLGYICITEAQKLVQTFKGKALGTKLVLIKATIPSFCLNQGPSTPANLMIWLPSLFQTGPSFLKMNASLRRCCLISKHKQHTFGTIWLYQLSWKCKLATVTSYIADVSSVSPSSFALTKG